MTNVLRAPLLEGFEKRASSVIEKCEASRGGYLDVYVRKPIVYTSAAFVDL